MNYFDQEALTWDDKPIHVERAKIVADTIIKHIKNTSAMNALEYGSGTGLLSFFLHDSFNSVVLMDESIEMLKIANMNINKRNINNIEISHTNLLNQQYSIKKDIIYTLMVLHHIKDINNIIRTHLKIALTK